MMASLERNNKPGWSVIITIITFIAVVATYIGIEYQRANSLERRLDIHHNRISEVEVWQHNWPRTGELNIDVRQNERIENIIQRLKRCEAEIEHLKP